MAAKLGKVTWLLEDYIVDGRRGEWFFVDVGSAEKAKALVGHLPASQHCLEEDYYDPYGDLYGAGLHLFFVVARDGTQVKRESCMFVHNERKTANKDKIFVVQEGSWIGSLSELSTFVVQKAKEQAMIEDAGEDVELKEYNSRFLDDLAGGEMTKEQMSQAAQLYRAQAGEKARVAADKTSEAASRAQEKSKVLFGKFKQKMDDRRGINLERGSGAPPGGSSSPQAPRAGSGYSTTDVYGTGSPAPLRFGQRAAPQPAAAPPVVTSAGALESSTNRFVPSVEVDAPQRARRDSTSAGGLSPRAESNTPFVRPSATPLAVPSTGGSRPGSRPGSRIGAARGAPSSEDVAGSTGSRPGSNYSTSSPGSGSWLSRNSSQAAAAAAATATANSTSGTSPTSPAGLRRGVSQQQPVMTTADDLPPAYDVGLPPPPSGVQQPDALPAPPPKTGSTPGTPAAVVCASSTVDGRSSGAGGKPLPAVPKKALPAPPPKADGSPAVAKPAASASTGSLPHMQPSASPATPVTGSVAVPAATGSSILAARLQQRQAGSTPGVTTTTTAAAGAQSATSSPVVQGRASHNPSSTTSVPATALQSYSSPSAQPHSQPQAQLPYTSPSQPGTASGAASPAMQQRSFGANVPAGATSSGTSLPTVSASPAAAAAGAASPVAQPRTFGANVPAGATSSGTSLPSAGALSPTPSGSGSQIGSQVSPRGSPHGSPRGSPREVRYKSGFLGKFSAGVANKASQARANLRNKGTASDFVRRSVSINNGKLSYGVHDDKTGRVEPKGSMMLADARVCAYKHNGVAGYLRVWPTRGTKLRSWVFVPWDNAAGMPRPDMQEAQDWLSLMQYWGAVLTNDPAPPPSGDAQMMAQKLGGSKMMPKWQDRWLVVSGGELIYYSAEQVPPDNTLCYEEKGRVPLKGRPVHNHEQSFKGTFAKAAYCVRLPLADKDVYLNCTTKADRDTLRAAMEKAGAVMQK